MPPAGDRVRPSNRRSRAVNGVLTPGWRSRHLAVFRQKSAVAWQGIRDAETTSRPPKRGPIAADYWQAEIVFDSLDDLNRTDIGAAQEHAIFTVT
jgi:hypothetical protein